MKKYLPWHHTRTGSFVLFLGSIELAVPILALTAIALAIGTYLDSTKGADVARQAVYGSWWFISTMALVSVSLIFAVITRYPWKRRHIGFITVHAGLLGLIAAGFISLFGRVEGHLPLEEGKSASAMETQSEQVQVVELKAGDISLLDSAPAPRSATSLTLASTRIQVVDRWENSREEQIVNDDAPMPFRGVQVIAQPGVDPVWVGEEGKAGPAPVVAGLTIRVLPDGSPWTPPTAAPAPGTASPSFKFVVQGHDVALAEEGQDAFPGWKIKSIKRFTRALVGDDGLIEAAGGPENPAIDVTITDGKGNTERHTAFQNFADMVMSRAVEGAAASGAKLVPGSVRSASETLIVFGTVADMRIGYISPTGDARLVESSGELPRAIDLGMRRITILKQFARARGGWQTLKAERAKENRPALVVRVGDGTELSVLPFKGMIPIPAGNRNLALQFGPKVVNVPFEIKLVEFRKTDYPGTDMAMAYESDVEVTVAGQAPSPFRIYMNHPYARGPWKVYQSGFAGDAVSIFSIMRDPGLPLTYGASIVLCVGILITFFSRSLSWGHPGIPAAIVAKEPLHVPSPSPASAAGPVAVVDRSVSPCGV